MNSKITGNNYDSGQEICLGIVLPCFNEEEVLPETLSRLDDLLSRMIASKIILDTSKLYFVDDGSTDRTWDLIESWTQDNPRIVGIKLSRNHGHQYALLAGLLTAKGDALISIDADLQDDVNAIENMLDAYIEGNDIVYGVRDDRKTDNFFKRFSAEAYYRLLKLSGIDTVFNHADYRLLSRRAINILENYGETNLFLRCIIPLIGLPSKKVYYSRQKRFAGTSKYSIHKMLTLALDGITSFSTSPLRAITVLGLLVFVISGAFGIWGLYIASQGNAVPGWTSTVVPIYFLGSIQLLSIGIIGEYLAKIYIEVKHRPRFNIEKITDSNNQNRN